MAHVELHDSGTFSSDFIMVPPELLGAHVPARAPADSSVALLDGDVQGLRCPECGSPMCVRLWLMVADCRACGCAIELTPEQEQELLRQMRVEEPPVAPPPRPAPPPVSVRLPDPPPAPVIVAPPVAVIPVTVAATPLAASVPVGIPVLEPVAIPLVEAQPVAAVPPPGRRPVALKPIGVRRSLEAIQQEGEVRVWAREFFRDMPGWITSMVFHMLAMVILATWLLDGPPEHQFTLTVRIDDWEPVGNLDQDQELFTETTFEMPSEFPVDQLAVEEIPVIDNTPLNEPGAEAAIQTENTPLEFQGSPVVVVGTEGIFDGRGEQARGHLVKAYGGTTESEACVALGLRWLSRVQEVDGSWGLAKFGGRANSDLAATGLGVLPFLGAGQTHHEGQYKQTVGKALDWLIAEQLPNGDLRGSGQGRMYAHGIATLALCEAYALTKDSKLRGPAQKAIDFIVRAQHSAGGWRYAPGEAGDTSVVGWQLMALRSGQLAKLEVPGLAFEKAVKFLDTVQQNDVGSQYSYLPGRGSRSEVMTAEALLCRQYTGWRRSHPGMAEGVAWLVSNYPPHARQPNIYYWYYATQTLHHYGGTPWEVWNSQMREVLVRNQIRRGELAGSWDHVGAFGHEGGRIFMTSLSLLTLEVYYRHLPIYDRPNLGAMPKTAAKSEPEEPATAPRDPAPARPATGPRPGTPNPMPGRPAPKKPFDPLDA